MKPRTIFVSFIVFVGIAANVAMVGCSKTVKKPACGPSFFRAIDGATCAECVDENGQTYNRCGMRVYQNSK